MLFFQAKNRHRYCCASLLCFCVALAGLLLPATAMGFWPFVETGPVNTAAPEVVEKVQVVPTPPDVPDEAVALQQQIGDLAKTLFRNLEDPDPENGDLADGVLITTFVDLKKLYRTSSLGRFVSEQLMTEMQQHRYTVVEMRKSDTVMVQQKRGEYGLTRDPAEMRDMVAAGAMLTGTYTPMKNHVMLNARIIDNRSAKLLASANVILPRNSLTEQLLADSVTAKVRTAEPIYMKRLEL